MQTEWKEIKDVRLSGQRAADRQRLFNLVLQMKLKEDVRYIGSEKILGNTLK